MNCELLGVVLAGGSSSRMGQDKALLRPAALGGKTMLENALGILAPFANKTVISCKSVRYQTGYVCIEDEPGISGPAAGILAGLKYAKSLGIAAILALACDLPAMNAPTLARLLSVREAAADGRWATLYQNALTGKVEMLVGIYEVNFLPALISGLASGERSLFWLLPQEKIRRILYGPELARMFINCNEPTDLERII